MVKRKFKKCRIQRYIGDGHDVSALLDIYVLYLLDRGIGIDTPYAMQRQGGMSLGASSPSLRRLTKARLVKRTEEDGITNRPRHVYSLTASGRELARNGWQEHFQSGRPPSDLDSILRLAEVASHYGAIATQVAHFLNMAAERRAGLSRRAAAVAEHKTVSQYVPMRSRCEAARLQAEAQVLAELASEILGGKSTQPTKRRKLRRGPEK